MARGHGIEGWVNPLISPGAPVGSGNVSGCVLDWGGAP